MLLARSRELVVSSFFLMVILAVLGSLAFRTIGLTQSEMISRTPGFLALSFIFCATIVMSQSYYSEHRWAAGQAVLLTGVDAGLVFFAKWLSIAVFLSLLFFLLLAAISLFYLNSLVALFFPLAIVGMLLAAGVAAVGTLTSTIAVQSHSREVILPILLFPLILPLLAGGLYVFASVIEGEGILASGFWFHLVAGYDCLFIALGSLLYPKLLIE